MATSFGRGSVRNVVRGTSGTVVQAGAIHGGVHFHRHPAGGGPIVVPRQLPAAPAIFAGRDDEMASLDRAWAERRGCGLVLVTGAAGVGKSALALRWAEAVGDQFPDGHLFVNLGAFDPAGPTAPGQVLRGFLYALGLPVDRVPVDAAEQAALFRSLTADRRMLIVLDNAVSAAQVRQLMPGGPACMVVVTARWRLGGLTADGATIVVLGPLGEQAAVELLSRVAGTERVADDPAAASSLVRLCAGLPIALSVTAARLAMHPRWPVRRMVSELLDEQHRLAGLSTRRDVSVQATFDLSYRSLSILEASCYRAVGSHPGAQFSADVIAAALDLSRRETVSLLDALVEANLLEELSEDRYQTHDLIKLHARQLAPTDPDRDRSAERIARWYLAAANVCDRLLTPYRRGSTVDGSDLPAVDLGFGDRDGALAWLERERSNLVATVVVAAETMPGLAWRIAYAMWPLFHYRRHHDDRMLVDQVAVTCARSIGNRLYEARMLRRLAFAHFDGGRLDEATDLLESSLELCRELDDRYGIAAAIDGLGLVALARRELGTAASHFAAELAICEELGERRRAGLAMLNLGTVDNAAGRPADALDHLGRAARRFAELDDLDPYNAARTRLEYGRALAGAGQPEDAVTELSGALAEMRRLGSPRGQAQALQLLGELALTTGSAEQALPQLRESLRLYEEIGDTEANDVRRLVEHVPAAHADPNGMSGP